MYKIIGADKQEYGPASAEEIRQWVAQGRANGETLVKMEGSSDWRPLISYPEFSGLTFLTPMSSAPPIVSRPSTISPQAGSISYELLPIGQCLSGGWRLLKNNFSLLFFTTFLILMIRLSLSLIPVVDMVGGFFNGVFYGGLYLVFLKRLRNEPASVGVAFQGFGILFVQLLLVGVISAILTFVATMCCLLPGVFVFVAWTFAIPLVADRQLMFWDAMELSRKTVARQWGRVALLLLLAYLPVVLFSLFTMIIGIRFGLEMVHSGKIDPNLWMNNPAEYKTQMDKVKTLFAERYSYLPETLLVLFFLVQPFAKAVIVQAYEILFGTRRTPSA